MRTHLLSAFTVCFYVCFSPSCMMKARPKLLNILNGFLKDQRQPVCQREGEVLRFTPDPWQPLLHDTKQYDSCDFPLWNGTVLSPSSHFLLIVFFSFITFLAFKLIFLFCEDAFDFFPSHLSCAFKWTVPSEMKNPSVIPSSCFSKPVCCCCCFFSGCFFPYQNSS